MSMSKYTQISPQTRERVKGRDGGACVICKRRDRPLECAHYISRAHGGLGIPQNLVMLCIECHDAFDGVRRDEYKPIIREYLQGWYPDWNEKELEYDKWAWTTKA